MKRILSSVLAFLMVLTCFAGMFTFGVSAEDIPVEFIVDANTLATTGQGTHALAIELKDDGDGAYCRYTVQGGDPYTWYNGLSANIKNYQYMEVTYRTSSTDDPCGAYFMNSNAYDSKVFDYIPDGQWHTVIVDLAQNSQWTPNLSQFRFDPQNAGSKAGGGIVDYKQVRFFNAQRVYWDADNALTKVFYDGGVQPGGGLYWWTAGNGWGVGPFYVGIGNGSNQKVEYSIDGGAWVDTGATFSSWDIAAGQAVGTWTSICEASVPNCAGSDPETSFCSGYQIPAVSQLDAGTHILSVRVVTDLMEYGQWDYELQVMDYANWVDPNAGDYNFTGSEKVAVRYNFEMPTRFFVYGRMATYAGAGKSFEIKAYKWDTDYATTVAAEPIAVNVKTNVGDNLVCSVDLGATVQGDVLVEYKPLEGTFTCAKTAVGNNSEVYINGNKQDYQLSFGIGNVSDRITDYDFTKSGIAIQGNGIEGDATFYGKAKRFGVEEYDGFAKLYQTPGGEAENYMIAPYEKVASNNKYASIVYRTTSESVKFELWAADAAGTWYKIGQYGYNEGEINTSGDWTYCYVPLTFDTGNGIAYYNGFRVDFIESGKANDYIDLATIRLYKSAYDAIDDMNAYNFKNLNKDQYILSVESREDHISYYEGGQGSPSTGTSPFGFKFDVNLDKLLAVEITNMATYNNASTTGKVRLWKWDTDLNTTKGADPIFTKDIINHKDNAHLTIDVSDFNLGQGTYYFECQVDDGFQWTPWDSTGTLNGATCYVGGTEHPFRCSTYQYGTVKTNICIGDSSTNEVTYEIDFSHYSENAPKEYGLSNANNLKFGKVLNEGYIHFDVTGGDPYVLANNCIPTTYTNLAKYAVVKYRTDADGVFQFFHNRKDGYGMGQGEDPTFPVIGDGEWHVVVADLSIDGWAKTLGGQFTAFRIDGVNSGSTYFDISYIKFYANLAPAQALYDSELTSRTDRTIIPAKNVIQIGDGEFSGVPDCDYELREDGYYVAGTVEEHTYEAEASKYFNAVKNAYGYTTAVKTALLINGVDVSENVSNNYFDKNGVVDTITFKGWLGNLNVAAFGYAIDDGDAIFNDAFLAGSDKAITAEGGPNSVYFNIAVDVKNIGDGSYNITPVVKTTDGSVFVLDVFGTFNYKVGEQTYKTFADWHKVEFMNGELVEVPYEAVDGGYTDTTDPLSCDTLYANGYLVKDGEAHLTLAQLGGVHNEDYSVANFALRGWYGSPSNGAIESFGYALNDGEPIWGEYKQPTEDLVKQAAGTEHASRYMVTIDTTKLADGCYNVYILVKHTNGVIVTLGKWNTVLYQGKQTYTKPGDCYFYYDVSYENIAKTPAIPVNPADVTGYVYFDGADLYTGDQQQSTEATYDKKGAYTHLVAKGGDSQYYQFRGTEYQIGKYLAIKYRCDVNMFTEGFIGVGGGATGAGDHYIDSMIGDGAWHILVIDISQQLNYTGSASYFRFDFIANATGEMDVQWVAFFQNENDVDVFDKLIWKAPTYYTATFVNEAGETVKAIDFKAGTEKLAGVPKVPAKDGYDGAWEAYTLDGDVTVKPVYTAKGGEETTAKEEETTTEGGTSEIPQLKDKYVFDVWTDASIKGVFASGCNQTEVTIVDDGVNFHWTGEGEEIADPYVTFNITKYISYVGGEKINGKERSYVVLKVKTLNAGNSFEIYAKAVAGDSQTPEEDLVANGEWEYLIFDMGLTSMSETSKVSSLRFDWSTGAPTADLVLGAVAFFATEDEALKFAGKGGDVPGGEDTTEETTAAVEVTTVAETVADVTTVAGTEETTAAGGKSGCGSVIGLGAIAIVSILGAGYVVLKKKEN